MKNLSIILAMLFLAFTVEAQNVEESKKTKDRKTTNTSVSTKSDKSSKARVAKLPSASRSSANRTTSSATRSSADRNTKNSSNSAVTRSSQSRSSALSSPQKRTDTKTRTNSDANRSGASRQVNSESSNRSGGKSVSTRVNAPRTNSSRDVNSREYSPKTDVSHATARKAYSGNLSHRVKRIAPKVHYTYQTLDYRRVHNPYNRPRVIDIYWNVNMYRNYRQWYPDFNLWYYPYGYRINTVSAYDSYNYIGEVARIYGRVSEVYYSLETGEYYLYFGGPYPYQDFTIILESGDAQRFSWDPVRYFTNRHLTVTGLVSVFEDKPEILVKRRTQISLY